MAHSEPRLRRSIRGFNIDFITICGYIIMLCPPPVGQTNGARLGWLPEHLVYLADAKLRWDVLMAAYNNKKGTRTTEVTDGLKLIIKEVVAYEKLHHLYDQVAISPNAITADYEAFRIKRSTPLAATTNRRAQSTDSKRVAITLKETGHLFHKLLIVSTVKEGRGKEDGVKDVLLYRAYTDPTEMAPAFATFQFIGNVQRSLKMVTHTEDVLYQKAWFIACVENTEGEIGVPSEPVGFIVT